MEHEKPADGVIVATDAERPRSNENEPIATIITGGQHQVHQERLEYAEFSPDYLTYIRRGGFRY